MRRKPNHQRVSWTKTSNPIRNTRCGPQQELASWHASAWPQVSQAHCKVASFLHPHWHYAQRPHAATLDKWVVPKNLLQGGGCSPHQSSSLSTFPPVLQFFCWPHGTPQPPPPPPSSVRTAQGKNLGLSGVSAGNFIEFVFTATGNHLGLSW